ncbi:MAG: hypothetical protein AB1Z55_00065 [Acidimicrobiia bacterium]
MPSIPTRDAARVASRIALLQFATDHPRVAAIFAEAGLSPAAGYFPLRLAPLGPVPSAVGQALMPFFPAGLVGKLVARSREQVPTDRLWEVGRRGLTEAADEAFGSMTGLEELVELFETAVAGADLDGRPLAAAWSAVDWDTPASRLFGAATVLREHRGEGHWMAVRTSGLTGDEMHVLARVAAGHGADGVGHGYRPEQVEAIGDRLHTRGLLEGWEPSSQALTLLEDIEVATDRLDAPPWLHLGPTGTERVLELDEAAGRIRV